MTSFTIDDSRLRHFRALRDGAWAAFHKMEESERHAKSVVVAADFAIAQAEKNPRYEVPADLKMRKSASQRELEMARTASNAAAAAATQAGAVWNAIERALGSDHPQIHMINVGMAG